MKVPTNEITTVYVEGFYRDTIICDGNAPMTEEEHNQLYPPDCFDSNVLVVWDGTFSKHI